MGVRGCLLSLVLVCPACAGRDGDPEPAERVAVVQAGLVNAFEGPHDTVAVIINFRDSRLPRGGVDERRVANQKLQDGLLSRHREGFTLSRQFRHVPALAGRIDQEALARLQHDPDVAYIQLDSPGGGQLKEAVPAIGADQVKTMYNVTGKGVTVAVLDTGIVTTHPDLKDALVAQHCFTQSDCPPGFLAREGTSAEDDHGHGSNVSGIVASRGIVSSPGFAPGASLVAVKVDDANDSGQESDWVAGLDWVYDNLATLKVKVINMSICTNQLFADAASCDLGEPAMASAVKNLVDAGVVIFSASGNRGSSTMMSAPACNTGVIAVGATYDSSVGHQPPTSTTYAGRWGTAFADCGDDTTAFDQITCFTNSNRRLDIVAPGAPITSDSLMGKTETYWGTSQASPAAAGVAALMLECNPSLTPAEIKQAMINTGVPRMDPKNGLSFPSLRALDAVRSVCFANNAGSGGTGAGAAGSAGTTGAGGGAAGAGATASGGASAMTGTGGMNAGAGAGGASGVPLGQAGSAANGAATLGTGGLGVAGTGVTVGANPSTGTGTGAGAPSSGCGCTVPGSEPEPNTRASWLAVALLMLVARLRARA